jgi:hypothetical protein
MCKTKQNRPRPSAEDLERAAWFARLAFGNCAETEGPTPIRRPSRSGFEVLP